MTTLLAVVLAAAGGALLWFTFEPMALPWAAVLGVALITVAIRGARGWGAVGRGLVAGLAFCLPLLSWLHPVGRDAAIADVDVQELVRIEPEVPGARTVAHLGLEGVQGSDLRGDAAARSIGRFEAGASHGRWWLSAGNRGDIRW